MRLTLSSMILLLFQASCGGSLVVPLYDAETVVARHPGLSGLIVPADDYSPGERRIDGQEGKGVWILGMVNYEGELELSKASNLSRLFSYAGSLSRRACLTQILVVRPGERKVIVCDYYRFAKDSKGERRQNLSLRRGDIVVVTRLYDPDRVSVAPEWRPIEQFYLGKIDRAHLIKELDR